MPAPEWVAMIKAVRVNGNDTKVSNISIRDDDENGTTATLRLVTATETPEDDTSLGLVDGEGNVIGYAVADELDGLEVRIGFGVSSLPEPKYVAPPTQPIGEGPVVEDAPAAKPEPKGASPAEKSTG